MPVCPNGCADEFDAPVELEISIARGRKVAGVCGCCGYQDQRVELCAA